MKKKSSYQKLKDEIEKLKDKNNKLKLFVLDELPMQERLYLMMSVKAEWNLEKAVWAGESSYKTLNNGIR